MPRMRAFAADYAYAAKARARHLRAGPAAWDVARYRGGALAPAVLIPGVYETWEFMRPVAERLHAAGHPVHVLSTLGMWNRHPIPESAASAAAYLQEHDLTGVVLVGHSKGGLIGKHLMALDDAEHRVDRLIAVCTPFGGSPLARYAPGRSLREFRPRAATVAMLGGEREVNARITSIYPNVDQYIPGGSALPGARNVKVPLIGHFALLKHPRVLDLIEEAAA